ncbi:hypothetical protein [Piscibacillus halophilus]|uniref:Yip1 domain-containing protein n=1 Tax=Piscibacillus halophilus TaxID=571933 RepID=A0A1H9I766_9BACI|nr:hypothetical protein [Piscibacillus halophilus]SEQ70424.1 hypothetical protein SAMN05216362_12321 [Piscibacillus halophilus]
MQNYLYRLFTDMDGQLFRIQKAEDIQKVWKASLLLFLASIAIYFWMAWLGMGTNLISQEFTSTTPDVYNAYKLWFIMGRALFAILLAVIILYLTSFYFYLFTKIRYKKLVIMQQVVLMMMLFERLLWIPLFVYLGLDWYVSPFSLGIITSYFTQHEWFLYFFGSITIIQIWIIAFQAKYLSRLSPMKIWKIWTLVIIWHLISYLIVATLGYFDEQLLVRWFES